MTMSVVTSVSTVGSKKLPPWAARLPPVTTLAPFLTASAMCASTFSTAFLSITAPGSNPDRIAREILMAEITPDPIMRIAMGFMAAKHLFVASEIGVFENLAGGPATLDELAAKCGVPRRTLGISADAMVSLGLLQRDGDRLSNSPTAAAFLGG